MVVVVDLRFDSSLPYSTHTHIIIHFNEKSNDIIIDYVTYLVCFRSLSVALAKRREKIKTMKMTALIANRKNTTETDSFFLCLYLIP